MYDWGYRSGYGFVEFLFMTLFMLVVVVGILWAVRAIAHGQQHEMLGEQAIDILKKRYAKGEITREEYERMKKDIA